MPPRLAPHRPDLRPRLGWTAAAHALFAALLAGCTSRATIEGFRSKHHEYRTDATYLPLIGATGTWLPEGTIDTEPGEIEFEQGLLEATVPVPLDEDHFLVVGALAGVRQVEFDGVPVIADDDLHRYGVRLGYGWFVDDDLVVQGYWQPSVYSDLDGTLNSDDYRLYYGSLLAVYRTSETWFWKAGLNANDAVDTGVIPLGGFVWHFDEEWSLQVLLPRDATLVHEQEPWLFSTGLLLESDEYHVRSPDVLGLESDVHVQELYAHVTAERNVGKSVYLMLRGGSTLAGDWDWGYGSGTDEVSGTLEPDLFLTAGINCRF